MLRTNLSTRPFYNVRAVQAVVGLCVVVVGAMTLFNAVQMSGLTASQQTLGARALSAEQEAERLRTEATQIRSQINPKELGEVVAAAREANSIIDRRAFSWTGLFSQFEATLPENVRITAVQPELDRTGQFIVTVGVEARRVEDLDAFLEALETDGTFEQVLAVQEQTTEDGLIQAVVEGTYKSPAPEVERPTPAATEAEVQR
jgi:hypothetical protein